MRIEQTYDDWTRAISAILVAGQEPGHLHGLAREWLNASNPAKACNMPTLSHEVACALGLDKRLSLQWAGKSVRYDRTEVFENMSEDFHYWIAVDPDTHWYTANLESAARDVSIQVTGHHLREEAIEHLERLLGRGRPTCT